MASNTLDYHLYLETENLEKVKILYNLIIGGGEVHFQIKQGFSGRN